MRIALIISLLISLAAPAYADAVSIQAQKRALAETISAGINTVLKGE